MKQRQKSPKSNHNDINHDHLTIFLQNGLSLDLTQPVIFLCQESRPAFVSTALGPVRSMAGVQLNTADAPGEEPSIFLLKVTVSQKLTLGARYFTGSIYYSCSTI